MPFLKRLLIIDDSAADREIYRHYLENEYEFLEAGNGKEGIDLAIKTKPDCILLDYSLPDMTGFKVLEAIKQDIIFNTVTVLVLTGSHDTRLAVKSIHEGALDFLDKNKLNAETLKKAVKEALENSLWLRLKRSAELADYTRSLIEASADPFVAISSEGKITDANQATEIITGISRNQLLNSEFSNYFTEPEQAKKVYRQVFSKGFVKNFPLYMRHVSGKITAVLYNANLYQDKNGNILGAFATARDINELREAKESLTLRTIFFASLLHMNEVILNSRKDQDIFTGVCRIAVQRGLATFAWVGILDSASQEVLPKYKFSAHKSFDVASFLTQPETQILVKAAWSNRHFTSVNGISFASNTIAQDELTLANISIACFPIFRAGQVHALFTLYTDQPLLFVPGNLEYLNTLANDITFALDGLDNEEKLLKSESRFTQLFQENKEACFILEGTNFIDANQAALKFLGIASLDQVKGRSPLDFSPKYQVRGELSVNKITELFASIVENGAQHFEWLFINGNGQLILTEIFATLVDYPAYKLVHAVCRDITASKKNAEQINQYEAILQSSNDAIISKNLAGYITSWNHAAEVMFGYTAEEILGQPLKKLLNDAQLSEEKLIDQKILAGEIVKHYETLRSAKNGQEINVSVSYSPIINDIGEIIGISKIARNISQQKVIEQELKAYRENLEALVKNRTQALETANRQLIYSEERFSFALEATNAGLWDWDMLTNKTNCSPDYFKLLGYQFDELNQDAESLWLNLLPPEERDAIVASVNEKLLCDGQHEHEFLMRHKSGEYRWILSRGKVIERDQNGMPIRAIGIHTDITLLKQMELELRNAKEKAEQANSAKSFFVANMSHEIRTPMNAVLGFCYLLKQSQLDEQTKQIVNKIDKASNSLLAIINDILDFSKIESGYLEIDEEPFLMAELLDSLSSIMMTLAKKKPLELVINPPATPALELLGDRQHLQQVLVNLVSNAIKFTDQGIVELRVSLVYKDNNALWINFAVQDTGIGMSDEVQENIFNPFTQADSSISRRFGGTGLGLAISQTMVKLLGGELQVKSVVGQGSEFYFSLPMQILAQNNDVNQIKILIAVFSMFKFLNFKQPDTKKSPSNSVVKRSCRF